MTNYTYKQSNHSLEKPAENHKNQLKLRISFLQLSRAVGKHCLLLLLFPWLTAFWACMRTQPYLPSPSAPPKSFSGSESPPPYNYNDELCQDDDLNVGIKPETITKEIPKTKQDAIKFVKEALKSAKKQLNNYIQLTDKLPRLESKFFYLDQAVLNLKKLYGITEHYTGRKWMENSIDFFIKGRDQYRAQIPCEAVNLQSYSESVQANLLNATDYIAEAKRLGAKEKYWQPLDKKKKHLESQLDYFIKKNEERIKNKANNDQKIDHIVNDFKSYFQGIVRREDNFVSTQSNSQHANQVIIQQNNQD